MTLQRRRELVQVAREYDACIITDDVYDMLQWPKARLPLNLAESMPVCLVLLISIGLWTAVLTERARTGLEMPLAMAALVR